METKKMITPYFEDGKFTGVRVCIGDEDFVVAPNDYIAQNDYDKCNSMTWYYAMNVLKENRLETFNHKQACLIAAYHKEINEILIQNGGNAFDNYYWTCDEIEHQAYSYYAQGTVNIYVKLLVFKVRLIKNLKEY